MKRKIFTVVVIVSFLISKFTNVTIVFSDEVQGGTSIEQYDGHSISMFENKETNSYITEPIESTDRSFEVVEKAMSSSSETEIFSEDTIEMAVEEVTSTTTSQENEVEIVSNSSENSGYIENTVRDSAKRLKYEEVLYNNQRFHFPIQEEIQEVENNIKDNHRLGSYVKSQSDGDSKLPQISDTQRQRPRWDFVDVSSYQGELSVADYEYIKKQGITGVVVKLTEGTFYKNPFAKIQIENAEKAGLKVSTYHFSRYTTKKGAESEAIYYAEEAKRLKLNSDTVMVNALEINLNEYSTQNAIFFANKLQVFGFRNLVHYTSSMILEEAKLSDSILGEEYLWIADYPTEPTEKNSLHLTNSAWQWSNEMTFESIPWKSFGVSSDYKGLFSNPIKAVDEQIELIKDSSIISEKRIDKYTTITAKDFVFWKDLSLQKKNVMSSKYFQQTLFVEKEFTLYGGGQYLSVKDKNNNLLGYVDKKHLLLVSGDQGAYQDYGKYVSINGNYDIWDGFSWESSKSGLGYKNQTFQARGIYHHFNGSRYLSLYDNKGQWLGYINESGTRLGDGDQGAYQGYGKYVSINGNYDIWEGFSWESSKSGLGYKNQTFQARGIYHHFNGSRYLSLYDNKGQWLGYINESGTRLGDGDQGAYQGYGKYVSINGNYDIWDGFSWESSKSGLGYKNQTFQARGIYHHFNGSRYLSLYDNKGQWLGYINESGTRLGDGDQGAYQDYGKYVSINGNYDIWDGFSWESSKSGLGYKNQTFQARGIYHHFNGSRYLSLYDNKGQWLGYINESGTRLGDGDQGAYQGYGKYVSINGNYDIWDGFSWESSKSGLGYKNQTFQARGIYHHFNGSRYLSLYDNKGQWLGYINESGTRLGNGNQGAYQDYGKYVTVKSNDELVYRNFNWSLQEMEGIGKKTFKAKGVYYHFNGTRYFSIYDLNNKWIGYISENSISEKTTHLFVMGHGSTDPGAVGSGTNEREFTRKELLPYLQKYAKKLIDNEVIFYDISRNMYVDSKKNEGIHSVQSGLSSITEIHLDAAGIGATGGHIIVHPKKKSYKEDLDLANVLERYNGLWGGVSKNNGLSYREDLLNLNLSYDYDVSYRLIELGFITNYQDVVKLRVNIDRIAKEFIEVVTGEKLEKN